METVIKKAIKGGWIKEIPITSKGKNYIALVSCTSFPLVNRYKWFLTQNGYAIAWINKKRVRMHHLILGKPPIGKEVDHINRNRLDNRLSNLRFVSGQENKQNNDAVGVRERGKSWEANICVNYQKYFKGGFKTKEQALKWRLKIKKKFNGLTK